MPTPHEIDRPAAAEHGRDALERLYVYWLVSTLLLLLVLATVVLMTRGALLRQAEALAGVRERLAALESRAATAGSGPAFGAEAPATPTPTRARSSGDQLPTEQAAPPVRPLDRAPEPASPRPATAPGRSRSPQTQGAFIAPPTDTEMQALLTAVLPSDAGKRIEVRDRQRASELVQLAQQHLDGAVWEGSTWELLAVVARLLERHTLAERLATRAAAEKASLARYAETSARVLLAAGRPRDALPFVEQLTEMSEGAPVAVVLLAAVLLAAEDLAAADEVLARPLPLEELDVPDRLLAGCVYFALERWSELERVLATLPVAPQDGAEEHAFLSAVSLARQGRTVEALAILDALLAEERTHAGASASAPAHGRHADGEATGGAFPERYDLEVWRGVTLMHARQTEAARQGLRAAAERDPGRPLAHYYLGVLEARAGRPEIAESHLKNALASSARLAPAWEALAILSLERDELETALDYLREALAANPRRASAHYLAALIYGRRTQRDAAAQALRAALQLDPAYLEEARQAEALTALFTVPEMESWTAAGRLQDTPASAEPAAPGTTHPPAAGAPATAPSTTRSVSDAP